MDGMSQEAGSLYAEIMPDDCPPPSAGHLAPQDVIRLVGPHTPNRTDFLSQNALGLPYPKNVPKYMWASCSAFLPSYPKEKLKGLLKYNRLRKKDAVAYLKVSEQSGKALVEESKHVHLWMYADYDPLSNIISIVKVDSYVPV
jgi:hypothetical protein